LAQKRIIIFTGPSLHPDEAKKILEADYRPPVARGDVSALLKDPPDVIGIIDGVFHQEPAVSHRELLQALQKGVILVGGASMGALRAAELDDVGMIGVGNVYLAYRDGIIDSDDDVAVVFNPETHELLSEALVSMSFNMKRAEEEGLISPQDYQKLYSTAKSIYYPQRTYNRMLRDSGLDEIKIKNLKAFLKEKSVDVKTADAKKVLEYIKNL
jgi:hypothetical protein